MSVTSRPAFVSRPPTTLPIAPAPIIPILITRPPRWFDAGVRTAGPRHVVNPTLGSVFPEVLESVRRQLGIAHSVHDVLVAKVVLQGPRVPPVVGELEAARMPQHVWMNRKLELGNDGKAREHLPEANGGHGRPALGHEHVAAGAVFPLEGPQRAHLLTTELVHAGYAILHAPHMDEPMREVDLTPGQSAQL